MRPCTRRTASIRSTCRFAAGASSGWRSARALSSSDVARQHARAARWRCRTREDHTAIGCQAQQRMPGRTRHKRKLATTQAPQARKPKADASRSAASRQALRILMIASEAQPFSKTGGLADVATALPKALGRLGHDVTLITPRYRGVTDGPVVGTVSIEMAAHRFNARLMEAPPSAWPASAGERGAAARLPRALRSRRHLLRRARRFRRQRGALRVPVGGRHRLGVATVAALRHHSRARLAGRPRAGLRARASARCAPSHARTVFTIHNLAYQGVFDKSVGAAARAAVGGLHDQRLRVLRSPELHEGRHQLRRCDHDGEPDLRRGDPAARVRQRPRRRDSQPPRRARRHSQRHRSRRVESGDRSVPAGAVRRRQPRRARPPPSARCSRRSASRSPTSCWRGR